jgi:hypothetical protein
VVLSTALPLTLCGDQNKGWISYRNMSKYITPFSKGPLLQEAGNPLSNGY